jgi:xanthine dehydrogenase YagT iron-sulfur-binding subunit
LRGAGLETAARCVGNGYCSKACLASNIAGAQVAVWRKISEGDPQQLPDRGAARRQFLVEAGALTTGLAVSPNLRAAERLADPRAQTSAPKLMRARLIVNGQTRELDLDPRVTLLDALRDHLRLTGTKKGCDRGQCGACTVLVNGRRVNACLSLALSHDGDEIVTVEGLGNPEAMHPMQQAFVTHDGYQCGYCTPGQVCSAVALVAEAHAGAASAVTPAVGASGPVRLTDEEIRERMSGNLCRCGAYVNIVAAIRSVAQRT